MQEKMWSRFAENFENLNNYVVGKEDMVLAKNEVAKIANLGYLLELGCGNGTYTNILEKNAKNILATDFSSEMIDVSKKRFEKNTNIEVFQANAMELPFENETFDTVFMANLLHIVSDCDKVLQEANRVLKPNGKIILLDFTTFGMRFFDKLGMIYRYLKTYGKPSKKAQNPTLSPKKMNKFLEKNNFKDANSKLIGNKSKAVLAVALKA